MNDLDMPVNASANPLKVLLETHPECDIAIPYIDYGLVDRVPQ